LETTHPPAAPPTPAQRTVEFAEIEYAALPVRCAAREYGGSVEQQEIRVTDSPGGSNRTLFTGTAWHYARSGPVIRAWSSQTSSHDSTSTAPDDFSTWQQAIGDIQQRFLQPDWQTGIPTSADGDEPHQEYWRARLSGTCNIGTTNSHRPGRSSRQSATSTRPRCPFIDYSAAGGQHSNKKSPTHCSRSTRRDRFTEPVTLEVLTATKR
jgi:hypothetical protein